MGECTGTWYWVRDLLVPQGIDLRLGHAWYLKAISDAKVKTDAVDEATPLARQQQCLLDNGLRICQ